MRLDARSTDPARASWAAAGLALALVLGALGCRSRPAAGERCVSLHQVVCAGGADAFVCEPAGGPGDGGAIASPAGASPGGSWARLRCAGDLGCGRRGEGDECDVTRAAEGDPCPSDPPMAHACTADRAEALVCVDGRFHVWRRCRGADACRVGQDRSIYCDTTLGEPGDPCEQQGAYSCAADGGAMLLCNGAVMGEASSCRGPQGCKVERDGGKVDCDDTMAAEGDPCDPARRIACAVDGKAELVCDGGKFRKKRDCARTDCRIEGTHLFCD